MARPNESYRANGAHRVTPPVIRYAPAVRHTPGAGMMARRLAQASAERPIEATRHPDALQAAETARKARERERSAKRRAAAKLAREAGNG